MLRAFVYFSYLALQISCIYQIPPILPLPPQIIRHTKQPTKQDRVWKILKSFLKKRKQQSERYMPLWYSEAQKTLERPLCAPSLLPRGKALHTTYSIMMMWWCWNTALIDSSGRTISGHVESATAATLSPTGAKYHPQRWEVLPNWYVAAAPWIPAERAPAGARNKAKQCRSLWLEQNDIGYL